MGLRDNVRSLISSLNPVRKPELESSPIVGVSAVQTAGQLPEGFFYSVGASGGSLELGFFCSKCNFTARAGADNGVVHCGKREYPPDLNTAKLETVRWSFPRQDGITRLPDGTAILNSGAPEWDGTVEYERSDPGF